MRESELPEGQSCWAEGRGSMGVPGTGRGQAPDRCPKGMTCPSCPARAGGAGLGKAVEGGEDGVGLPRRPVPASLGPRGCPPWWPCWSRVQGCPH